MTFKKIYTVNKIRCFQFKEIQKLISIRASFRKNKLEIEYHINLIKRLHIKKMKL